MCVCGRDMLALLDHVTKDSGKFSARRISFGPGRP